MTIVSRNTLQQKRRNHHYEQLAPDPFTQMKAPCVILRVFDAEAIEEEGVGSDVAGHLSNHPGWLFAEVLMLDHQTKLVLPFQDPEEFIYSVYGNRALLEGRIATIHYANQNPQNGSLVLQRNHSQRHLALGTLGQVFDIGALV